MNVPVTTKVRFMALGWMLLSALVIVLAGCRAAPPPDLQRELTEQFQTVPALPDSKETGRRFIQETTTSSIWRLPMPSRSSPSSTTTTCAPWGDGVWKYQGSNAEKVTRRYVKDGWELTIKPAEGRAILLLRRDQ